MVSSIRRVHTVDLIREAHMGDDVSFSLNR